MPKGSNPASHAPKGNKRAVKDGPKRGIFPSRIREDLIERIEKIAQFKGLKTGEIADQAFTQYIETQVIK